MDATGWSLFVTALVVVYLLPGPDMILVWQTGLAEGRLAAFAVALGLACARAAHVALAALGLATLFRTLPWTWEAARLAGAIWLVALGVAVWRSPSFDFTHPGAAVAPRGVVAAFARGLATNLLNPKALMFCSMLLPQFVWPALGGVELQFLRLGAVLVGLGLGFDVLYGLTGAAMSGWVAERPRFARTQRGVFALLLVGFGLRLGWPFG